MSDIDHSRVIKLMQEGASQEALSVLEPVSYTHLTLPTIYSV